MWQLYRIPADPEDEERAGNPFSGTPFLDANLPRDIVLGKGVLGLQDAPGSNRISRLHVMLLPDEQTGGWAAKRVGTNAAFIQHGMDTLGDCKDLPMDQPVQIRPPCRIYLALTQESHAISLRLSDEEATEYAPGVGSSAAAAAAAGGGVPAFSLQMPEVAAAGHLPAQPAAPVGAATAASDAAAGAPDRDSSEWPTMLRGGSSAAPQSGFGGGGGGGDGESQGFDGGGGFGGGGSFESYGSREDSEEEGGRGGAGEGRGVDANCVLSATIDHLDQLADLVEQAPGGSASSGQFRKRALVTAMGTLKRFKGDGGTLPSGSTIDNLCGPGQALESIKGKTRAKINEFVITGKLPGPACRLERIGLMR